jgi:hypothetical protein
MVGEMGIAKGGICKRRAGMIVSPGLFGKKAMDRGNNLQPLWTQIFVIPFWLFIFFFDHLFFIITILLFLLFL